MKRLIAIALLVGACNAAPAAIPTPTPTAGPTQAPIGGTGVVTFGTSYDADTLEIPRPLTRFKVGIKNIAWSASLSESAGATSLTFVLASRSSSGTERIIIKRDVDVSNPAFDTLANEADLSLLLDRKAGGYVLRYLRGSTILAEGQFTLVK